MSSSQVCVFGTSSDPPTSLLGHAGIVSYLASTGLFSSLIVVPVYRHMFETKRDRATAHGESSSFAHKLAMCELQFSSLGTDTCSVTVSDVERRIFNEKAVRQSDPASIRVGTLDLLTNLTSATPLADFHICLGADSYRDLATGKWFGGLAIRDVVGNRVHVIERQGVSEEAIEEEVERQKKLLADGGDGIPATVHSIDGLGDVSSSQARETDSEHKLRRLVGDEVTSYIIHNKLFKFA